MPSFVSLVDMHLVEIKDEARLKSLLCCAWGAPQVMHTNAWDKVFPTLNKAKVKDRFSKWLHYKHNTYLWETLESKAMIKPFGKKLMRGLYDLKKS